MENEVFKRRALLLWQEGQRHHLIGDLSRAVDLYNKSIAVCPTAESHTARGGVYHSQGRVQDAISECKKAIALDPGFGTPYNDIGSYLITLGKMDEAEEWLKKAKDADRCEYKHVPYMNLGRVYAAKGLLIMAAKEFEQALEIFPGEQNCSAALAHILRMLH